MMAISCRKTPSDYKSLQSSHYDRPFLLFALGVCYAYKAWTVALISGILKSLDIEQRIWRCTHLHTTDVVLCHLIFFVCFVREKSGFGSHWRKGAVISEG